MNPMQMLKLEWSKYFPNGMFRLVAALYAGSFVLVVWLAQQIGRTMTFTSNGASYNPTEGLFVYPHNWELVACIGSWMNIFLLGSLGVFMITMEFSNRTLRQSVIFGLSRWEVAVSKLVWALAIAVAATGFYFLVGLVQGGLNGAGLGLPPTGCVLRFFLQASGYLLLGSLLGLLIRQTALAAMAYLAYVLFLETACRWVVYLTFVKSRLLLFLPHQVLEALTPMPLPESVGQFLHSNPLTLPLTAGEATLGALVYLGLFGLFFCRRIVKSDL